MAGKPIPISVVDFGVGATALVSAPPVSETPEEEIERRCPPNMRRLQRRRCKRQMGRQIMRRNRTEARTERRELRTDSRGARRVARAESRQEAQSIRTDTREERSDFRIARREDGGGLANVANGIIDTVGRALGTGTEQAYGGATRGVVNELIPVALIGAAALLMFTVTK